MSLEPPALVRGSAAGFWDIVSNFQRLISRTATSTVHFVPSMEMAII